MKLAAMEPEQRPRRLVAAMERQRAVVKVGQVGQVGQVAVDVALAAVMEKQPLTSNMGDEFNKEHSDE